MRPYMIRGGGGWGAAAGGHTTMISMSGTGRERRDSRALLRDLLINLPAAVGFVAGPDLTFEFANEEYQRLFGGRDLIGLPLREALPDLPKDRVEALERVLRTGEPRQGRESELWIERPGRAPEQLFMDFIYQPVRDDAGSIDGVLFYGSDVTSHVLDRRRLEQLTRELASSEERYRTLFETLPLGVIHFSATGTILGANPAATRILGLPAPTPTVWPARWSAEPCTRTARPSRRTSSR